jgi:hypothetical protein
MLTGLVANYFLYLFAFGLILTLVAVVDLSRRDKYQMVGKNKTFWLYLVLLLQPVGALVYLFFGRKARRRE